MSRSALQRLLGIRKQTRAIIAGVLDRQPGSVAIVDDREQLLLGAEGAAPQRYPVSHAERLQGWVVGGADAAWIAELLVLLLDREEEKKALAGEVLEKYRELNLLYDLAEKLAGAFGLESISALILSEARRLCEAAEGALILCRETGQLQVVAVFGQVFNVGDMLGEQDDGLLALIQGGQPEVVNHLSRDPRFHHHPRLYSLICAPIRTPQRLTGALLIGQIEQINYTAADLKLLTILAAQAAPAIENALFYAQLERYNRTLEQKVQERTAELAEANREVREALVAAETANEAKSAFLASMSHEIRTPMNAIIGMTSLLQSTSLTSRQFEFTEIVRSSSDALLTIINDILDFSKIEAGRLELERQPFDLRDCVEGALDLVAARAAEKHLDLVYVVDGRDSNARGSEGRGAERRRYQRIMPPPAIIGDVTRLRQVLVNLLNNAVKFTERGEVVLAVTENLYSEKDPTADIDGRHLLHFVVMDTGIGIPVERMDRLFKPFSQVDSSTTRRYGGTGLGLIISRRLVELMGGEMWVESELGRGSVFHFTILAESADSPINDFIHNPVPWLAGKRLLVVAGNAVNRRMLTLQAQSWGMLPMNTGNGDEALGWVRQGERFQVMVVDNQLPWGDSLSLVRALRNAHTERPPPVLLMVPMGQMPPLLENTGGHIDSVINKPIKPSQFYEALQSLFTDVTPRHEHGKIRNSFDTGMAERLPLRILLVEDNANNQKLALLVLERLGYQADLAANGVEALLALERQPYDVVLMDVQMPEMDGLEAARRIRRERPGRQNPRIIAMTANAMASDRDDCLAAGMDDYLSKPIRIEQLVATLWCADTGARSAPPARSPAPATTVLNPRALESLEDMVGGRDYLYQLIDTFLEESPGLLLRLRESLEGDDPDGFRLAAHSLKSNCADYGASHMTELCKRLEAMGRDRQLEGAGVLLAEAETAYAEVQAALTEFRHSSAS